MLGSFYKKLSIVKILKQNINDVYLIESEPFIDERGAFRRHFCAEEFANGGVSPTVKQANISENKFAKTLRGFHCDYKSWKMITCVYGKFLFVVVIFLNNALQPLA